MSYLNVIQDVASYLGAGLAVEDELAGVAGTLERGLPAGGCRIWVRRPDGTGLRLVQRPGAPPPPAEAEENVAGWVASGEVPAWSGEDPWVRLLLGYQGQILGMLECRIAPADDDSERRVVVGIVANLLAPLLSSIELSEDLAGEVALRTREIEAQRRFTAKIIDSLPVGLYVIDRAYRIQAWNRKRETGTQGMARDDVIGRPVFEILHRQPRRLLEEEFDRVFETGKIEEVEVSTHTAGEPRYYRITKIPMRLDEDDVTHVITIGEDVTQSRLVQQQISQTEKLAAVGQLAAGVMHEINNPLATIGACVEALDTRVSGLPAGAVRQSINEYLQIVESELTRCQSIVDGLLDFSRPKARAKRPSDINQLVEDALFLVRYHDRFKRIKVEKRFARRLPQIQANAEQLIQAFLDLMLNAIDAMDGDGTLTVGTGMNPEREDEVMVEISDTGMGIARENVDKIFEPFFTTKAPGHGTGLGLSITYSIVSHHGGRVLVDSQVGSGSTFRVMLPLEASGEIGA